MHSGLGILYRLYSELQAMLYVLEHYNPPLEKIRAHLDALKYDVGDVFEFPIPEKKLAA